MTNKFRGTLFTLCLLGALSLIFFTINSAQAAFPADIVAYWRLDEAVGPTYVDDINANNGTGSNDPTAVAGQVNDAQDFDGLNDGINVPDANNNFDWGPYENFTIEFWMKSSTAAGTNEVIIGREDVGSFQWYVGIQQTTGFARFVITAGGSLALSSAGAINDGGWHHIVAMRYGEVGPPLTGEWRLYVDNNLEDSSAGGGADLGSSTANINIGHLLTAFRYEGTLDQVAIYTRALTEDEIEKNYNLGLEGLELDDDLPDDDDDDDDDDGGGGGGSSGCFISTSHQ